MTGVGATDPFSAGSAGVRSTHARMIELISRVGGAGDPEHVLAELDSLALVELVVEIESEFELEIPDESLDDAIFDSVSSLSAAVDGLRVQ